MRACPGPQGFIEAGPNDDWWDPAGAAGAAETGAASAGADPTSPVGSSTSDAGASGAGAASGASGASGAGAAGSVAESAPARVLSMTPADGALGVRSDAQLVIQFSQPMAKDSVEAAYHSSDLPTAQVSFVWNERRTELTISPTLPLQYATGAAAADGSVAFSAKAYAFGFHAGASAQNGDALPELAFSFRTLRQVSYAVPADTQLTGSWTDGEGEGIHNCARSAKPPYVATVCVGDDLNNVRYDGFLSFDLSALPAGIVEFSSARLQASARVFGSPERLGDNRLAHVWFAELGPAALSAASLAVLGPFYTAADLPQGTLLLLSQDLTGSVIDDYANRAARAGRSQYRLSFANVTANRDWDDLELPTANIRLATTYLIP